MKKKKKMVLSLIIITTIIVVFSSYTIFKDKENNSAILAYFYDGENHREPPAKELYEVEVVNCDKAVGTWNNTKWELTLKEIEEKTKCIISFQKRLPIYMLRIDPSGGTYKGKTGIQEAEVKETTTYQLSEPTRKGYTFAGWEVEGEQSSVNDNTFTMGVENSKVTAKWNINTYEVEIRDTNTCDETKTAEYNSTVELCNPVKEGYTFTGWETTSGTLGENTLTVSDANAIVTANWVINNYNYIVYHKQQGINGGYVVKDTETKTGAYETRVSPNVKTYTGFTSPSRQTITISSDTNNNKIEYEYTRNKYNLTINANGGETSTQSQEVYFEQQVNVVSPTKTGYTFTSWSGATLQDTILTMPASNVTLTANYRANTYILYFDANQGSVSSTSKSVTYDSTYGQLPTPVRTGYTFTGWYINGTKIESSSIVKITQATSAVANWIKNSYILTIDPNEGTYNNSTSMYEKGMEYDEEFIVADPVREGYTFDGWTLSGTDATYNENTKVFKIGTSNATLEAKWQINTYKLTISGTNACDGIYDINYKGTYQLCEPINTGHTFAGWEDEDNIINGDLLIMKAKDSSITAKWTTNTYNYIVYHNKMNLDGTTYTRVDADTYTSSGEYGTVIVTEAKTYTGFKNQTNKSITIGVEENTPPTTNVVNYNYERKKYTLTVNSNGGTYSGTTPLELYYEEQSTLGTASKTGYNFTGWTKSGNSTLSDNTLTMGSENTTLTANYEAKTFVVTFNPNEGSVTTTSTPVTYDSTYGELPTPIRTNYDFLGWYTDPENGSKVESTDTVRILDNQTLYAHWQLSTVTITYNATGGTVSPSTVDISKGGSISTLAIATRSGYTFLGWYTDAENGTQITTSTVFNSSQTIYAHWYLIENAVTKIRNLGPTTDELLTDATTDNNLRYVGSNPNNYVEFNGELWRIIGVMNNVKTSTGTTTTLLKIKRAEVLGYYSWDTTVGSSTDSGCTGTNCGDGINQWGASGSYEGADLMRELNTDYLGTLTVGTDGKWFNGNNNSKSADKPSSTLSSDAQNMIETVVWNLGSPSNNNGTYDSNWSNSSTGVTAPTSYARERANTNGKVCSSGSWCNDTVTRTSTWTGKVGLFYPSDYLYATAGGSTTSRNLCLTTPMYIWNDLAIRDCKDNDWLKPRSSWEWTLSPFANSSGSNIVFFVTSGGDVYHYGNAYSTFGVSPVVFLKSNISITNGDGSSANPYVLGL